MHCPAGKSHRDLHSQRCPILQEVTEAFEREGQAFAAVVSKAIQAYKASEAAKKARELVRRKNVLVKSTLPGKLADCSGSDVSQSEIFIVEGDSAGGGAWPFAGCKRGNEGGDRFSAFVNCRLQDRAIGGSSFAVKQCDAFPLGR